MFIGPTLERVEKRAFQRPYERVKIVRGQLALTQVSWAQLKRLARAAARVLHKPYSRSIDYGRLPQSLDKTV